MRREVSKKIFKIFSNDLFFILASAFPYSSTKCAYMGAYIPTLLSFSTSLQLLFRLQTIFISISTFQLLSFFVPVFSRDWLFFPSLYSLYFSLIAENSNLLSFNLPTFPALMFPPPTPSITHRAPQEQLPPPMGSLLIEACKVWADSIYNVSFRCKWEGLFP